MGYLYKIEFENGKSYIGITSKDAVTRLREHEKSARYDFSNAFLHKAMRKYPDAYRVVPLLRADDWGYLQLMEVRAIAAYGTKAPNGYNLTDGGDGQLGVEWSAESREKAAAAKRGKPLSAEHRAKVGAALKGRPSPTRGMTFGPETRAKHSAVHKGKPLSAEHRAKIAASHIGIGHSAETKRKLSAIVSAEWALKKLAGALL
jgi:hypothetical protein